jgi:hypothetical protein
MKRATAIAAGLGCAFGMLIVMQLTFPAPAVAIPNPLDVAKGALDVSLNPVDWMVDGFRALLHFMFGEQLDELGRHLLALLLAMPLLTDKEAFPGVNAYRQYVTYGAWGILPLTFVYASMRYWLSSYSGSGSYEALQGFMRTVVAVAMLLVFPVAFDGLMRATNMMSAALIKGPTSSAGFKGLAGVMSVEAITDGSVGMFVAIAAVFMGLVLLVVKVVVTALIAVLFVLSPLAIVLWPVEELSWALRSLVQSLGALMVFPCVWAVCFGTFAVLPRDAMFPGSYGDLVSSLLTPLIALASLIIALRLPFKILELAGMQGSISPGVGRGLSQVRNASYARSALTRVGR